MPVDTLVDMARRKAAMNPSGIVSVGDLPWELVRPIIQRIENPAQLVSAFVSYPSLVSRQYLVPTGAVLTTDHRPR